MYRRWLVVNVNEFGLGGGNFFFVFRDVIFYFVLNWLYLFLIFGENFLKFLIGLYINILDKVFFLVC